MIYIGIFKWPKTKVHYIIVEDKKDINPEIIDSISRVIKKEKITNKNKETK